MSGFRPPWLLRGAHVQSLLGCVPLRRALAARDVGSLLARSGLEVLECGQGVRLLAEITAPAAGVRAGTVILIHGWEGSARSMYMLTAGARLWQQGFRVVRLNLRDHGNSHHLNAELFHSCRLEEVLGAVRVIQRRFAPDRLYIAGFSLGGNFALRIAAAARPAGLEIARVAAVCPVLDPRDTLEALDTGLPAYRRYFMSKWRRSLQRKRAAFPRTYDFGDLSRFRTLSAMTEYFVRHYTDFPDLESYLGGYALTGERLRALEIPAEVLLAEDDPLIPVRGLQRLARPAALRLTCSRFGGHCGFIADFRLRSWADDFIVRALTSPRGAQARADHLSAIPDSHNRGG